ncbi:hypothetical protein [Ornithinimicrobium kibberense]|uniref:hypothetical protein n=1 Tax=Ornithinimicrobium kibberense TaxID=282060 RepID=UPI00360D1A1C
MLGLKDRGGGEQLRSGDGVDAGPVGPAQRFRFDDGVGLGRRHRPATRQRCLRELLDPVLDPLQRHVDGADATLGLGPDVPHLPRGPGRLHGVHHPGCGPLHPRLIDALP